MRALTFLFALVFLSITCLAQQSPFDAPNREDFQDLQRKMSILEKKLSLLEKKLKKLEKKKAAPSRGGFVSKKADPEELAKIVLEEEPTEDQVRTYLGKIAKASQGQNSFSTRDAQVDMLREIPSKYLKLILSQSGHSIKYYIGYAIPDLVEESHKELVIKSVLQHQKLIDSIIQFDWIDDAWPQLLMGLKGERHLSDSWIRVIANKNKEDGNIALLEHITRRVDIDKLQIIKATAIPKEEIKKAVLNNWKVTQYSDQWQANSSALCAIQYGDLVALKRVSEIMMSTDQDDSYLKKQAWPIFAQVLDHDGSALDWYKANKDKLTYDETKGKFVIKI